MPKNTGKPTQVHKTKAQLLSEIQKNTDFQKKMKFTKEVFFPAVCDASENINEAQMWLAGFNTALMQEFLSLMRDKKMKDLNLSTKLAGDFPKYKAIIDLFDDFSIFDAKDNIEGLRNEIDLFIREENEKRPLSSLPTKWADEIK